MDLLRRVVVLAAVCAVLVLASALVSCARTSSPTPLPAARLGTVVHLTGTTVRATGVVARYPVVVMGRVDSAWVLYSALGSTRTAPVVIAQLFSRGEGGVTGQTVIRRDTLAPYDGQLVQVAGTLSPPVFGDGPGTSPPWSRLDVASIATASPEQQARIPWRDSLVKPGQWFDVPWRYNLAQAYQAVQTAAGGRAYPDVAEAEKAYGASIPIPSSPLAGRLVGVVASSRASRYKAWMLAYSSGLDIEGPLMGTATPSHRYGLLGPAWIASQLPAAKKAVASGASVMQERLVKVNGRPGIVGENNGLGANSNWLSYWDGTQVVTISYVGLGKGPSDADLMAVAASMRP